MGSIVWTTIMYTTRTFVVIATLVGIFISGRFSEN